MTANSSAGDSGQGSRPTTSGGVDNIGGASSFTPGKAPQDGESSPMPPEKMAEKKNDKAAMKRDDSAPWNLRPLPDDVPNTEPSNPEASSGNS